MDDRVQEQHLNYCIGQQAENIETEQKRGITHHGVPLTSLEGDLLLVHGLRVEQGQGIGGAAEGGIHCPILLVQPRRHRLLPLGHEAMAEKEHPRPDHETRSGIPGAERADEAYRAKNPNPIKEGRRNRDRKPLISERSRSLGPAGDRSAAEPPWNQRSPALHRPPLFQGYGPFVETYSTVINKKMRPLASP